MSVSPSAHTGYTAVVALWGNTYNIRRAEKEAEDPPARLRVSTECQGNDRTRMKGKRTMAVAIEQDRRKLTHIRLVAHTEKPGTAWISLQEGKHCPDGTVSP